MRRRVYELLRGNSILFPIKYINHNQADQKMTFLGGERGHFANQKEIILEISPDISGRKAQVSLFLSENVFEYITIPLTTFYRCEIFEAQQNREN